MGLQLIPKRKINQGYTQSWQPPDSKVAAQAQTIASKVTVTTNTLDTIYQNTTPRLLMITISVICQVNYHAGSGCINGYSRILVLSDAATPPTTYVARGGLTVTTTGDAGKGIQIDPCVVFFVQPNHYYKVTTAIALGGVTPSIAYWTELTLRN